MTHRARLLLAMLTIGGVSLAGLCPAQAQQRPPMLGKWYGQIQCGQVQPGRYGLRYVTLFMYGDGTGLLELGMSPFAPGVPPAVAMVALRALPEADVVLIDQWVSNGTEPRLQLSGQIGADLAFSGQVLNDAHCDRFRLEPQRISRFVLRNMARNRERTAQGEAAVLDPHMTVKEGMGMGLLGWALTHDLPRSVPAGQGRSGGARFSPPDADDGPVFNPPSVGGDVHGNRITPYPSLPSPSLPSVGGDVHGNAPMNGHGVTAY